MTNCICPIISDRSFLANFIQGWEFDHSIFRSFDLLIFWSFDLLIFWSFVLLIFRSFSRIDGIDSILFKIKSIFQSQKTIDLIEKNVFYLCFWQFPPFLCQKMKSLLSIFVLRSFLKINGIDSLSSIKKDCKKDQFHQKTDLISRLVWNYHLPWLISYVQSYLTYHITILANQSYVTNLIWLILYQS